MEPREIVAWIIVVILGLPAAIHYSLRLKSQWGEHREKCRNAKAEVRIVVTDAINKAKEYDSMGEAQFHKLIDDARTLKKLRRRLCELKELAEQYEKWRHESWETVYNKVTVERTIFEDVDKALKQVSEGISGVFDEKHTTPIYRAIYEGNLTPKTAKELLLRYRRNKKVKLKDRTSGEEKELSFREVVEGDEFHSFVEMLMRLSDRESVTMLRHLQRRFLDTAEAIMKEV